MRQRSVRAFAWLLIVLLAAPPAAIGQQSETAPVFKQEELDQLAAPIALYPDSLIAQILMASTGGGILPLDLRKSLKHYNTSSSFRHGLPEPITLTWMSPDASCEPGCRQSMPA